MNLNERQQARESERKNSNQGHPNLYIIYPEKLYDPSFPPLTTFSLPPTLSLLILALRANALIRATLFPSLSRLEYQSNAAPPFPLHLYTHPPIHTHTHTKKAERSIYQATACEVGYGRAWEDCARPGPSRTLAAGVYAPSSRRCRCRCLATRHSPPPPRSHRSDDAVYSLVAGSAEWQREPEICVVVVQCAGRER